MRFMMLMIPKGYETAAPGTMPDAKAVAAMMKYNEELQKAGVLVTLDGLHPPSMARARFIRWRQAQSYGRPFPRDQRGARRLLDDQCEIEGRGRRMGVSLPGVEQRSDRGPPSAGVRGLPGRRSEGRRRLPRNAIAGAVRSRSASQSNSKPPSPTTKFTFVMQTIHPCLWFDTQALEAAKFYISVSKNSKLGQVSYYGEGAPLPKGTVLTVTFQLEGQNFMALNGGPVFKFNEAVSFVVNCETQEEIDDYWKKLTAGGQEVQCGWLKDKYGLSWQIVPTVLGKMMEDKDPAKTNRVMQALMKMVKLDIHGLQQAYNG